MLRFDANAAWLASQPVARAMSLPAECYVADAFDQLDRRAVFARSWQLLANVGQLSAPGDHAVGEIAGVPLIVIHAPAAAPDASHATHGGINGGTLFALHNVCRHRGGPLATCDGRGARALTCKYHGWTYELDGRLRGAPEMAAVDGFDRSTERLPAARVSEWHGLVFAALQRNAPPFPQLVSGIAPQLDAQLRGLRFHHRTSYDVDCNWKVYVDNYLEGYHITQVHPELAQTINTAAYTTRLGPWYSLQAAPIVGTGASAVPAGSSGDAGADKRAAAPTPSRNSNAPYGQGEALYYFLFPNTMLNILPGRLQTNRVIPLARHRCRVDFDYYYDETTGRFALDDEQFSNLVQAQDAEICAAVQRGLESRSYTSGRLHPQRELGVWHFHELLRRAYREQFAEAEAGGTPR